MSVQTDRHMHVSNNHLGMGRELGRKKKKRTSPPHLTTLTLFPSLDRTRASAETEEMCGWTEQVAVTETWQVHEVCALCTGPGRHHPLGEP